MKLSNHLLFFALAYTYTTVAQVGIGTTNPNASLDIQSSNAAAPSNTDGLLVPKVDEFPATNPAAAQDGMLVYATGNGSVTKGFYFWNNGTSNWDIVAGGTIDEVNDLVDGKSDPTGSSIFIGENAGLNDDNTNNFNTAMGFEAMMETTRGGGNTAVGYQSLNLNTTGRANTAHGTWALRDNEIGIFNTAIGLHALIANTEGNYNDALGAHSLRNNITGLANTAIGSSALNDNISGSQNVSLGFYSGGRTEGDNNVFLGCQAGAFNYDTKSGSVFIGYQAGYSEDTSNKLYIENSSSSDPLIYGEFDNDLLRVNGDMEVEKATAAGLSIVTPFGFESSLKLFERSGSADFGFEFEYDGTPDKLYLWSRRFAGNEGIRMTWLKDGRVGIGTTSPHAKLDLEASNATSPSTTDGFLVPRIDAFPATNPGANQNGMLVFLNTDNSFYYWNNSTTSWVNIQNTTTAVEEVNDLTDGRSNNFGSSIFIGASAGQNDDGTDNGNTGMGYMSLRDNTSGSFNTAFGSLSLLNNTTGEGNSAFGRRALQANSTGTRNSTFGHLSMQYNTSGFRNTAHGYEALQFSETGDGNTAIGCQALLNNTTGNYNTAVGYTTSLGNNYTNTTAIGYNANPNSSNQVRIGNASIAIIGGFANWSVFSDERVKTNIREDVVGLEFIKRLRPVSYNYDMDAIARFEKTPDSLRLQRAEALKAREVQTGFIAQEVEAAATAAGFDFHGVIKPERPEQPYALRYSEFVVPVVKAIQEQQAVIEEQAEEIMALRREILQIKLLLNQD